MPRTYPFELVHYGEDAAGQEVREVREFRSVIHARGAAGRLSKKIKGPVDLADAGDEPWSERYVTTASPSPHHSSGYRFERLD